MRLRGKVSLITGAGSGFGEGMARRFAEEGAKIIVADINDESGHRVAREIGAAATFIHADVSKDVDVCNMVEHATKTFGKLDIVVNNAGYTHRNGRMTDVTEEEFDRIFSVNVKGIFLAAKHAVPVFRANGGGVFLNIASTAGVRPPPNLTWYNASKGAAIVATKSMAIELASSKIRVCALNPSVGDTGMLHLFMGEDTDEKRDAFTSKVPLGRLCMPTDIANAALFLCSDEAEFLTGVCLDVDGGRSI